MSSFSISDILLRSIGSFYIVLDRHGFIVNTNNDITAFSTSPIFESGEQFCSYFNKRHEDKIKSALTKLVKKEESLVVVKAPMELDIEAIPIKWSICAINNQGEGVTGFEVLGVISKSTSNETELGAASVFNQHSQPFFTIDLFGKITCANHPFYQLLEIETGALTNLAFLSLTDSSDNESIERFLDEAVKGKPQQYLCTLVNFKNKKIPVTITNTPQIQDGVFKGVNAFVKPVVRKQLPEILVNTDEKRLKVVLSKLKKILASSLDIICTIDEKGRFTNVSAASKDILGYQPKELLGKNSIDFVHNEDIDRTESVTIAIKSGVGTTNFENRFYKKDGSIAYLVWSSKWEELDRRFYCIARDATEKKISEASLKASEEKYRVLFYNHPIPSWIYDVETLRFIEVNEAAINHYGYSREEFMDLPVASLISEDEVQRFNEIIRQEDYYQRQHISMWLHKKKNNQVFYAEITSNPIDYKGRNAKLVLSIDRTVQTMAEQELRKSNERFIFLSEATFDAIWDWDLKTDKIEWNDGVIRIFNITQPADTLNIDWWYQSLHPEDRERVETKIKYHIDNNISHWEDEYRMKAGSTYKYIYDRGYIIHNDQGEPVRMIGAIQDLTERKAHENMLQSLNQSLEKRASELAESNAELERFAYVASHDLQEPLRMVTSFLQLLEKRYKDKLDNKANEYINYAVDGAERMKRLILDLLEYSRVNSSKLVIEEVDVNEVVKELKFTYKTHLLETNGAITAKRLPVVKGNKTQILQLFQNLISNALKYKSDAPPAIDISYEEEKSFYRFAIADNGIGINPKFFNKIFIIFQRLHNRDEYSGTGIGLAICKKIIDKHGGSIWVTSTPGKGSTFYFTFPKS